MEVTASSSWRGYTAARWKEFVSPNLKTPIPGLERPILVHVDYVNHRIERLTLEEHAVRLDAAGVRV